MDLHEATQLEDIAVISPPSYNDFLEECVLPSKPVLIRGLSKDWPSIQKWNLDYIQSRVQTVQVQKPDPSGVYHFLHFDRIPFSEFRSSLTTSKDLYLSADPILTTGLKVTNNGYLSALADDIVIPECIKKEHVESVSLWIGPGENKSLLHFDYWHSFLTVIEGRKRFATYDSSQTRYLFPYSTFDIKSIIQGRILDSKINPRSIGPKHMESVRKARGLKGEIRKGDVLFIPAGTWHYVESFGMNIGLNIFTKATDAERWKVSPLKEYKIKTNVMLPLVNMARKIKNMNFFEKVNTESKGLT